MGYKELRKEISFTVSKSLGHYPNLKMMKKINEVVNWRNMEAMIKLNDGVLQEFVKSGVSINEGITVDARLIKSASRPMSNDDLRKLKEKRNRPEGQVDNNGNLQGFSRDVE